jgi:hypothetical protein
MSRLAGYGGAVFVAQQIVEDCEDAWNEQVDGDVTLTLETSDVKVGSGCQKMVQAAGLANGDIMASEVVSSMDLSGYTVLYCWAKSTVTVAAGTYRILLDNDANCASPEVECDLPALTANEWKFCQCAVATGAFSGANAVISVGIELQANDPGAATLYIDHIEAAKTVAGIRAWSVDETMETQDVTTFADGGHRVFLPTLDSWSGTFEGFKDGAPLPIGTVIGLELRESSTATQQWRGSAIITGRHPKNTVEGVIEYAYDFQGTHALEAPTT